MSVTPIVPTEESQYVIAICKRHAVSGDAVETIRELIAKRYKFPIELVYDFRVYATLLNTLREVSTRDDLAGFFTDAFGGRESVTRQRIMEHLTAEISMVPIQDDDDSVLIDLSAAQEFLDGGNIPEEWKHKRTFLKFETRFKVNPDIDEDDLSSVMWAKSEREWICTDFVSKVRTESTELFYVMQPLETIDGVSECLTGNSAYVVSKEELDRYFVMV